MRRLIALVFVSALGVSAASAPVRKPEGLSTKSFGEGGGYKHPDAAVGGFLESTPPPPPPAAPSETRGRAITRGNVTEPYGEEMPLPKSVGKRPASTRRQEAAERALGRPRPRPFAPVVPDSSLRSTNAAALDAADDAASDDARRDYEERLLGAAPEAARPGRAIGERPASLGAAVGEGSLFITLELDPREAGSLRDAVAGLGAAAAFRPDARFEPLPGEGGSVRVSGWLPVSRLGEAIARPGVKRVVVERGSRGRAPASGLVGDFLVGLRVADAAHPEESVAAGVVDLAETAGFVVGRVPTAYGGGPLSNGFGSGISSPYGSVTLPQGAVAVVAGSLPLNRLSRAMGRPGVVTVRAAESYREPVDSSRLNRDEIASKMGGFLRFVMRRGAWLALLTLLLALPAFGPALKKGLAVFVPYR